MPVERPVGVGASFGPAGACRFSLLCVVEDRRDRFPAGIGEVEEVAALAHAAAGTS